jgi:hypothetical protein
MKKIMTPLRNILALSVLVISFSSCFLLGGDPENLSLERQPYNGDELRLDGYYYEMIDGVLYSIHFIYKNGVLVNVGGADSMEEFEEKLRKGVYDDLTNYRIGWGVFHIEGKNIKFEEWYPSSGGPMPTYIRAGEIINDTTFHITVSYKPDGSERREKDERYHFKEFSPKPDSTNPYID